MEKFKNWLAGPQFKKFYEMGEIQENTTRTHYVPGAGAFWLLAGCPGAGKSTFGILNSIGFAQTNKNKQVGYFQWDFVPPYMLSVAQKIENNSIELFENLQNYYYSDQAYLEEILGFCDAVAPGSLVIIDYIQRMKIKNPPPIQGHELLSWAISQLQEKTVQKNIVVIGITRMNRSSMKAKNGDEDMTAGFGSSMLEFSADASIVIKNMRRSIDDTITWTFSCPKNRWGQRIPGDYDVKFGPNDFRAFFSGWDRKKDPEEEKVTEDVTEDQMPF